MSATAGGPAAAELLAIAGGAPAAATAARCLRHLRDRVGVCVLYALRCVLCAVCCAVCYVLCPAPCVQHCVG